MGKQVLESQHNRAASTVFDLELDEFDGFRSTKAEIEGLRELIVPTSPAQLQLWEDAQRARALAQSGDDLDLLAFAEALALNGYLICLRTGKPDKCCAGVPGLKHTFVVAGVAAGTPSADRLAGQAANTQLFVVDPCFRDSFLLSNATTSYQCLCDELPPLFVGTAEQLVPLVEYMCHQMQLVFTETGVSCPPWRQPTCMISKWLPSSVEDTPVVPSSNTSEAPAEPGAAATTGNTEESPFADPTANSRLACPLIRTTSSASASTCGQLVYTPRAKTPYYSEASNSILLFGSPPAADANVAGFSGRLPLGCEMQTGSSCLVYAGCSPASWQGGRSGCFGLHTSWKGSGAPVEAYYSYREEVEQLDCEGAVAIKSGTFSVHSERECFRGLQHTKSALTTALASASVGKCDDSSEFATHCSLDIARLNGGAEDMDLVSPRLARQQSQHQQSAPGGRVGSISGNVMKHHRMSLLSSALNEKCVGQGWGRV